MLGQIGGYFNSHFRSHGSKACDRYTTSVYLKYIAYLKYVPCIQNHELFIYLTYATRLYARIL